MRNDIKEFNDIFLSIFKKKKALFISLALVCLLSYGFTITHHSVGVDNTGWYFYLDNKGFVGQGRLTPYIFNLLTKIMVYTPFWNNAVSTILIYFGMIFWCMLFILISKDTIKQWQLIIFSTLFISYPIINEQFIYTPENPPLMFLFSGLALYFLYSNYLNHGFKNIPLYLLSAFCIFWGISLNEVFASVFLVGVFITLMMMVVYREERLDFKQSAKYVIIACMVLAATIVVEALAGRLANMLLNVTVPNMASNSTYWFRYPLMYNLILLVIGVVYRYFLSASFYYPVAIYVISIVSVMISSIIIAVKTKRGIIVWLAIFLILSTMSLVLIKGHMLHYRLCVPFAPFVAFTIMLATITFKRKWINGIIGFIVILLIINQTRMMNDWFVNDYQRYEKDREVVTQVAKELERDFDKTKPLVFMGNIERPPQTRRVSVNGESFLGWAARGITDEMPGKDILIFLKDLGYDFEEPTKEQYYAAKDVAANLKEYPQDGYIKETKEYIVVNLGDNPVWKMDEKEQMVFDRYKDFLIKLTGMDEEYVNGQLYTAIN
jgi:hypothetical protein